MIEWLFSPNGFGVLLTGVVVLIPLAVIVFLAAMLDERGERENRERRGLRR